MTVRLPAEVHEALRTVAFAGGTSINFNRAEVGGDALAGFGLLKSAVLRPPTTIGGLDAYPSVHEKAAALMHSLIRNHPFVDGDSRTAVVVTFTFPHAQRLGEGEPPPGLQPLLERELVRLMLAGS